MSILFFFFFPWLVYMLTTHNGAAAAFPWMSQTTHTGHGSGTYDSDQCRLGRGTQLKSQSPVDGLYLSINNAVARTFNCIAGFPSTNLFATDHSPQIGRLLTD